MIVKHNFIRVKAVVSPVVREARPEWSGYCQDCPYFGMCGDDCGRLGFSIDTNREPRSFSSWLRR